MGVRVPPFAPLSVSTERPDLLKNNPRELRVSLVYLKTIKNNEEPNGDTYTADDQSGEYC
jgi:hypothetical protein